jgi:glucosylceramidase
MTTKNPKAVKEKTSESTSAQPSQIRVIVTSANKQQAEVGLLNWQSSVKPRPGYTVELFPDMTFQKILGFGSALTEASCFNLQRMPAEKRDWLMHNLFDPSQQALNVNRTCIGASDYSTVAYTYDESDEPDPDLKNFSIAHDRKTVLPTLRQARKINPGMFLFSSPWTPPGWMKASHTMLGGNMRRQYMQSYAMYFVKFLKAYAKAGVKINGVTINNEVDTDQGGAMPQCSWPQEYEVDFVRYFLGPMLKKHELDTLIWFIDHNPNLWGRALASLNEPDFRQFVDGVAWHTYGGDAYRMAQVHDAYPDKGAHWTEGGSDVTDPNYARDHVRWGQSITSSLRNRCSSITTWNLVLDEHGKPNIGPFPCGGLVTVNSETFDLTFSGLYQALGQFSRHVRRGAVVFESLSALPLVTQVAFVNPDGERVLVLTNSGSAETVSVRLGDKTVDVSLEAGSVTTLVWKD